MNPAPSKMHYVYILKSKKYEWIYTGFTSDLRKRLTEHMAGKNFSTKKYLPIKLVYYEAFCSEIDAMNREKHLKQYGNSMGLLKKRIKNCILQEGAG